MIPSILRAIRASIKETFAPFILWDDCGTRRYVWNMSEALEWLPACGDNALIVNRKTRKVEVSRHQSRAY